jgi:hypothetical protein
METLLGNSAILVIAFGPAGPNPLHRPQRLIQIRNDVFDILNPD